MADIDVLNSNGLLTKDNNTLVQDLVTNFIDIYSQNGEAINFESNTPDRQLIEIIALLGTVIREQITNVYNSINPDNCVGAVQDNRYQINYLTRKVGAFTTQEIAITTDRTVYLQGLDAAYNDENASAYAISDNEGNIWYLIDSATLTAGTSDKLFRAAEKGSIVPTIGTITNQVTIEEGVTNVINSKGVSSVGYEEESDSDFRIRRSRSTMTKSENNFDTIWANLESLDGVTDVNGAQNVNNSTDANGIPAHNIWFIVEGGANTEIANIIYANMGGTGTYAANDDTKVTESIITSSLQTININFNRPQETDLYIKFELKAITDIGEVNQDKVKEEIANNLAYKIGEVAETSKITEVCANALIADGGNAYALNVQISKTGAVDSWTDYLAPTSIAEKFVTNTNIIEIVVSE